MVHRKVDSFYMLVCPPFLSIILNNLSAIELVSDLRLDFWVAFLIACHKSEFYCIVYYHCISPFTSEHIF